MGVHAVKEPPHTAGFGTVQPTDDHLGQQLLLALRHGVLLRTACVQRQRKAHTADLLHRPISPSQGDGTEGSVTLESGVVPFQELAPPDGAVGAVAGAVPDDADAGFVQPVVRHAGGHVGVVMLHLHQGQPLPLAPLLGVGRGEVVRMQVTDQSGGGNAEQALEMFDLSLVVGQSLGVFQVADVLTQEERPPFGQGEDAFCSAPQATTPVQSACKTGAGAHSHGAPQKIRLSVNDPQQRVITTGDNISVMHQEPVSDPLQVFHCLVVVIHDRTIRAVGAGHNQGVKPFHEQVVEGGIGKHNA